MKIKTITLNCYNDAVPMMEAIEKADRVEIKWDEDKGKVVELDCRVEWSTEGVTLTLVEDRHGITWESKLTPYEFKGAEVDPEADVLYVKLGDNPYRSRFKFKIKP